MADAGLVEVVLVGGPHDGAEYLVPVDRLGLSIRTADVTERVDAPLPTLNEYRARRCYCGQGHWARSGSGRVIFDFVGSIY